MIVERTLDALHAAMRRMTGLKLVSDIHERQTFPGIYPPLDPKLRRRLTRIRDAGVLFIHIPKNAGMSVSSILYGDQVFHPTIRYYQRVANDIASGLPSFAIWRNPVERFVSAYCYARAGGAPNAPVARAFRKSYGAFQSLDSALDHVAAAKSLYDVDHIFRPQFWYVADQAGRIAVDNICMIDDLDRAVASDALPGLRDISRLNRSKPIKIMPTRDQVDRLHSLYAIDFAIYESLQNGALSKGLNKPRIAAARHDSLISAPPLTVR